MECPPPLQPGQAAFTFQRKDWMEIAATLAQWLSGTMTSENGTLYPVAYEGTPQGKGILDDYTYTAEAFLRYAGLVAPLLGEDPVPWIDRSAALIEQVATRFKDDTSVGFYLTSESHAHVIHRKKDWFDNAQPSGNAALIHAISLHSAMTGESTFLPLLESMKTAYPGLAEAAPMAVAYALHGFSAHLVGQAVIHYRPGVISANCMPSSQPFRTGPLRSSRKASRRFPQVSSSAWEPSALKRPMMRKLLPP
jgi:uncharacterized protein YyaL (SSP411 family)